MLTQKAAKTDTASLLLTIDFDFDIVDMRFLVTLNRLTGEELT